VNAFFGGGTEDDQVDRCFDRLNYALVFGEHWAFLRAFKMAEK
jgi:hypothetical protein